MEIINTIMGIHDHAIKVVPQGVALAVTPVVYHCNSDYDFDEWKMCRS